MLVGGATFVLFPLTWAMRKGMGLDASEYSVGFLAFYGAYVVNDPHFAATYLLFYKDARRRAFDPALSRSYRARYFFSGFVVPAVLATWAVTAFALRSAQALGWMIQGMFFLVGWHYVKQGFGVLAVLSARRGTRFQRSERGIVRA